MDTKERIEALQSRALALIDFQINSQAELLLPADIYHLATALEKLSRISKASLLQPLKFAEIKSTCCRKSNSEDQQIDEIERVIQLSGLAMKWTQFTPSATEDRHRIELKIYDPNGTQINDPKFYGETEGDALQSLLMWLHGFVAHKQMGYFHE